MKYKIHLSFWLFIVILFVLAIFYFLYQYAIHSPYKISSEVAKILIKNNKIDLILDVRTEVERNSLGFYPGSINISTNNLATMMPKMYPNKNNLIIIYCNSGQRARNATEILHKLGYLNTMYIATTYSSLMN